MAIKLNIPSAPREPVELFGTTLYVRKLGYREMLAILAKAGREEGDADGSLIVSAVEDEKGQKLTLEQLYAFPQAEHDLLAAKVKSLNKLDEEAKN